MMFAYKPFKPAIVLVMTILVIASVIHNIKAVLLPVPQIRDRLNLQKEIVII